MAKKNIADLLVDTLARAAVERVYGLAGDSLNGITDAIRRHKQDSLDSRTTRRDGRLCRRGRGPFNWTVGGLRRKLWSGKPAFDQWTLRLPSQSCSGACNRRSNSKS